VQIIDAKRVGRIESSSTAFPSRSLAMVRSGVNTRFVRLRLDEIELRPGEDLRTTGFTAVELSDSGKAHDRWPAIAGSLLEGSEKRITIEPRNRQSRCCRKASRRP